MCSQNAGNAISEIEILKKGMPQTPLTNSCLPNSAHTFIIIIIIKVFIV